MIIKSVWVLYSIHRVIFCVLTINIEIGAVFVHFNWYSKNEALTNSNPKTVKTIY